MIFPVILQTYSIRQASPAYSFGVVSALDVPKAIHDFVYTNDETTTEVIAALRPSCSCTTAGILEAGRSAATLPYSLGPGRRVTIRVTVDLSHDYPGEFDRTLSVYLQGQDVPAAVYTVSGTVSADADLSPRVLDFGSVPAGQTKILIVTARVDSRLAHGGFPRLVSDNPNVEVSPPVNPGVSDPLGKRDTYLESVYTVTVLSDSALGPIRGSLTFSPGLSAASIAPEEFSAAALLDGSVDGAASVNPQQVGFGTVAAGAGAEISVSLTSRQAGILDSIRIASGNSNLSAQLSTPTADPNQRLLNIVLSKDAPPGIFSGGITLYLVNGQRLTIPVNGYVAAAAGR